MAMDTYEAYIGYGSSVAYSDDGGSTWTEFPCVEEIDPPVSEVTKVPRSHLKVVGRVKDTLPGLVEQANLKFKIQYEKTRYAALYAIFGLKFISTYRVKWRVSFDTTGNATHGVGDSTFVFEGYLCKLPPPPIRMEETAVMECEVAVTSGIAFTATVA